MRFGPYEVERELGRGGAGVVYLARTPGGEPIAVKLLEGTASKDAVARFDRERRLLALLGETEGFVPLLDAGSSDKGPWLAMPFVPGGNLRGRMEAGPISVDASVELAASIARALARAHDRGIVHRDLKPENILFTADGTPLVADLGLAKHFRRDLAGASRSLSLTSRGGLHGTIGYMAPEQLEEARDVTPQADVFSLGAILYELLGGKPAFAAATFMVLLAERARGLEPEPLEQVRPELPAWLIEVVRTAMAQDLADRFPDAHALVRALEQRGRRPRRRWMVVAGGLVALATVGGAVAVALVRSPQPPPPPLTVELREPNAGTLVVAGDALVVRGRINDANASVSVNGSNAAVDQSGEFTARIEVGGSIHEVTVEASRVNEAPTQVRRPLTVLAAPDWFRRLTANERPPLPLPPGLVFGTGPGEYTNLKDQTTFVFVPAGAFLMGSDTAHADARPPHEVELAGYFLGKFEVTNEQFERFVSATGYVTTAERVGGGVLPPGRSEELSPTANWRRPYDTDVTLGPHHPVVQLAWRDAAAYATWAGSSLPTEAQWEKAARSRPGVQASDRFPWGTELPSPTSGLLANLADVTTQPIWPMLKTFRGYNDGQLRLAPVGSYPRGTSIYGAHDLMGNAMEWCRDHWDQAYYRRSPRRDPVCSDRPGLRVLRGASWMTIPVNVSIHTRSFCTTDQAMEDSGLRLVRELGR